MNFPLQIARYVMGILPVEKLPEMAIDALRAGSESPSLIILAGLHEKEDTVTIHYYLQEALYELQMPYPDERTAAIQVAEALADQILSGEKNVVSGVQEMLDTAINRYLFWKETEKCCYGSIGFDGVYFAFLAFDELSLSRAWPWQKKIPEEEQFAAARAALRKELEKWRAFGSRS